jgi:hypothetical protein
MTDEFCDAGMRGHNRKDFGGEKTSSLLAPQHHLAVV